MKMGLYGNNAGANSFTRLSLVLVIFLISTPWCGARHSITDLKGGEFLRSDEEVKWLFDEWQVKHDRSYHDLGEKQNRFEIFKSNLRFIDRHNRPENNRSFTVGLNSLADLSNEEYRSIYLHPGGLNMSRFARDLSPPEDDLDLSPTRAGQQQASIDWRDQGAVGPVMHQGGCACCWAIVAVATVEGINAIVTGNLVTLSVQELVDCQDFGTHCQPGQISSGYRYIRRKDGIDTEENYPYEGRQGECKADRNQVVTIDDFKDVPTNSEISLSRRVALQPVGSTVDAAGLDFQLYDGGIYDGECTTNVNHAVTIVGYDSEDDQDYWIIKNSYGVNWGEEGYMKLPRNVAAWQGNCGIAMWPEYPVKNRDAPPSRHALYTI